MRKCTHILLFLGTSIEAVCWLRFRSATSASRAKSKSCSWRRADFRDSSKRTSSNFFVTSNGICKTNDDLLKNYLDFWYTGSPIVCSAKPMIILNTTDFISTSTRPSSLSFFYRTKSSTTHIKTVLFYTLIFFLSM